MPLSARTIKSDIWSRTGLDCNELQEPVLDSAIKAALSEFARYHGRTLFGQFHVIAQQTDYVFPSLPDFPANLVSITDVFYDPQISIIPNFSFADMLLQTIQGNVINLDFGGNIFENPSLVDIWFTKLRSFRDKIGDPPWRVLDAAQPKILQLLSVPTQTTLGYWEGFGSWLLEEILPEDNESFILATMWKAAENRAMKLALAKEYREGSGIMVQPAIDFWDTKSKDYKKQFLDHVGAFRGSMAVG